MTCWSDSRLPSSHTVTLSSTVDGSLMTGSSNPAWFEVIFDLSVALQFTTQSYIRQFFEVMVKAGSLMTFLGAAVI